MKVEKNTKPLPTQNGSPDSHSPVILTLPKNLTDRIQREYQALAERQKRLQAETDNAVRGLLEGYMAAFPQTEGRNFNLSDDRTRLIEVV